jgi:hypothetical protein
MGMTLRAAHPSPEIPHHAPEAQVTGPHEFGTIPISSKAPRTSEMAGTSFLTPETCCHTTRIGYFYIFKFVFSSFPKILQGHISMSSSQAYEMHLGYSMLLLVLETDWLASCKRQDLWKIFALLHLSLQQLPEALSPMSLNQIF